MLLDADLSQFGIIADQIETQLRALGLWDTPGTTAEVTEAFGAGSLSFNQWLEHVLAPRLRQIASGQSAVPLESHLAAKAAREFDYSEAQALVATLAHLDCLVASLK